jgi:hypothetical protein
VKRFDHFGFQFIIARSFQPFDIHPHGFGCIELLENYIRIVLLDRSLASIGAAYLKNGWQPVSIPNPGTASHTLQHQVSDQVAQIAALQAQIAATQS